MDQLNQFYNNEAMRLTIHAYLLEHLKSYATEKLFNGDEVKGIYDAKQSIDRAFSALEEVYGTKEERKVESPR